MRDIKSKYLIEMTDEENPIYMFQTTPTTLILKVALGKIDAKKMAGREMANRGFGKKGEWIGFPAAEKLWKVK